MKSLVYETPVNSAEELVARISAAAGEIRNTSEMLSNVRRSMKRRCEACITCGKHRQSLSLWKQFQNDGTVVRRPGQGRKRMTTASEDRYLTLTARRNRKATAHQLSSELAAANGAVASRQTIYRRLNEKGLYARKPRSRFSLTGDSKRVYIWRESGTRNDPSNIMERDRFGSEGVMWDYLGRAIARRHPPPRDVNGLKTALLEEWEFNSPDCD
ncbi:transposable element Tc1 transposase [Trichonephila clavipes]|nr:transposable element Tc1 transposase [Trichonephila clavipes]